MLIFIIVIAYYIFAEGSVVFFTCIIHNLAKANSSQDMDNTGKKHHTSFSKNAISDYDNKNQHFDLSNNTVVIKISFPDFTTSVTKASIAPPHQPPRC